MQNSLKTIISLAACAYLFIIVTIIAFLIAGIRYTFTMPIAQQPMKYSVVEVDENQYSALLSLYANNEFLPLSWSADKSKLLLIQTRGGISEHFIFDSYTQELTRFSDRVEGSYETLRWDVSERNMLYGIRNNVITRINLEDGSKQTVLASILQDYLGSAPHIFFTKNIERTSYLYKKPMDEISEGFALKLPKFSTYRFLDSAKNIVLLFDTHNEKIYVLNKSALEKTDTFEASVQVVLDAKNVSWSRDGSSALLYNSFEIWDYQVKKKKLELLERTDQNIRRAKKIRGMELVLYSTHDKLYALKGNTRSLVAEFDAIKDFFVGEDGQLFIVGEIKGKRGIYIFSS